jgi:hypothetical protein
MRMDGFSNWAGANGNNTDAALPSFFIIGPPRTGTTWLHSVLSECARLSHPTKETRFFDEHFDRGLDWYRSHYRENREQRMVGEVAPTYFASREARERIAHLIPHAKIVCTFRNPADRVLWNFEEALTRDPELMESSRYASHLKGWEQTFGSSQVMVTVHDDIEADPQSFLDKVVDFIGAPRLKLLPGHVRRVLTSEGLTEPRNLRWTRSAILLSEWAKARRLDGVVAAAKRLGATKLFIGGGRAFAELSSAQRTKLRELFRPEVDELETMLNRDFSAWK